MHESLAEQGLVNIFRGQHIGQRAREREKRKHFLNKKIKSQLNGANTQFAA